MTRRMRTSRDGIELIKNFEGFRPRAVKLASGGFLIGYGHRRSAREGAKITEADAELLLREYDLPDIEASLNDNVLTPLQQNEFDALASFTFNVGLEAFEASEALALLNAGEKIAAVGALSAWRMARLRGRMTVIDALVRRRAAEIALFLAHPSGPVPVPTALVAPRLDVGSRSQESSEEAVGVESLFEDDKASLDIGPVSYEDFAGPVIIEDEADDEVGAEDQGEDADDAATPEQAAERVKARLTRILDDGPEGPVAARIDEDVEGPSIEEITAAVSALADDTPPEEPSPDDKPPPDADDMPSAKASNGTARRSAAPELDELEDAETVMRRIEAELASGRTPAGEKVEGFEAPRRDGRWTWPLVAVIGAILMLWGMADRFDLLPVEQTMTGSDFDPLPPLLVLSGLILVGLGIWNMIAGSLREGD